MKTISKLFENLYDLKTYDRPDSGKDLTSAENRIHTPTQLGPNDPPPGSQKILTGPIEIDQCANLYGWQEYLVKEIRTNKDIYILSEAGSGKTAPVICYWVNDILGLSTSINDPINKFIEFLEHPEKIKQILWLAPIKNLTTQLEQETIERFVSIILQILNKSCTISRETGNLIFTKGFLGINRLISAISLNSQTSGILTTMLVQNPISKSYEVNKNMIQEFITTLGDMVFKFVKEKLVGRIEEGINTVGKPVKPFIIAIYESASNVIDDMDKLRLIVFDEAQRVQGDEKRAAQIGDSIHKVLSSSNGQNAKLVMLSGSVNPKSASHVTQYFNEVYNRNFKDYDQSIYRTPSTATNQSTIVVSALTKLKDPREQLRICHGILAEATENTKAVFVLLSKDGINRLIDQLAPTDNGFVDPKKYLSRPRPGSTMYNLKPAISSISNPGDINDISEPRLRRAAGYGIAYLYRPDTITPATQRDTSIIQKLFIDNRLRLVFATDAIREGITIKCNVMYIPTITHPGGKKADLAELTQLVNRAGRERNKIAKIYTSEEFVSQITSAFSTDPYEFEEQPFTLPKSYLEYELNWKWGFGKGRGVNISLPRLAASAKYKLGFGKALIQFFRIK